MHFKFFEWSKVTWKVAKSDLESGQNTKKHKWFISASERPRTVLNVFLECMYFESKIFTPDFENLNGTQCLTSRQSLPARESLTAHLSWQTSLLSLSLSLSFTPISLVVLLVFDKT